MCHVKSSEVAVPSVPAEPRCTVDCLTINIGRAAAAAAVLSSEWHNEVWSGAGRHGVITAATGNCISSLFGEGGRHKYWRGRGGCSLPVTRDRCRCGEQRRDDGSSQAPGSRPPRSWGRGLFAVCVIVRLQPAWNKT